MKAASAAVRAAVHLIGLDPDEFHGAAVCGSSSGKKTNDHLRVTCPCCRSSRDYSYAVVFAGLTWNRLGMPGMDRSESLAARLLASARYHAALAQLEGTAAEVERDEGGRWSTYSTALAARLAADAERLCEVRRETEAMGVECTSHRDDLLMWVEARLDLARRDAEKRARRAGGGR